MKIVFTYWSQGKLDSNSFFKELAAVSNFFAQKHGYETVLYTDDLGESLLYKINYNNIIRLPDYYLNKFPKDIWNMGKLLTTSLIKEPFIHLDFDLLLYKPIQKEILNKDIVFFHEEIWMDKMLCDTSFVIKKHPKNLKHKSFRSYNCAMFGGQNYELFNTAAKEICDFVIENSIFLEKMSKQQSELQKKGLVKNQLYLPNLVEQLWLPNLLKNNTNIETILHNTDLDKYQSINYIENYNPADFLNQDDLDIFIKEYHKYYYLISLLSKYMGHIHFYSENTNFFKEKIIQFAKQKNLKY